MWVEIGEVELSASFEFYQGSGIRDQGSGIRDQGSGIRDQGSGIGDQGSGIRNSWALRAGEEAKPCAPQHLRGGKAAGNFF
jgi:hypothetical protein